MCTEGFSFYEWGSGGWAVFAGGGCCVRRSRRFAVRSIAGVRRYFRSVGRFATSVLGRWHRIAFYARAHHFVDMPLWRVVLFRGKGNGASICGMCMDQKSKFCVALRLVSRAAFHSCLLEYPYELIAGVAFWDILRLSCWIPCKTCLRMNVSCTVVQSICGTRQVVRCARNL